MVDRFENWILAGRAGLVVQGGTGGERDGPVAATELGMLLPRYYPCWSTPASSRSRPSSPEAKKETIG